MKDDEPKKFYASPDGEMYRDGPYDSIEEAVREAPHGKEDEYGFGSTFHVGAAQPVKLNRVINHWDVVERLHESVGEEVGEIAVGWLEDLTPKQEEDLEVLLDDAIKVWLKRHDLEPKFFSIVDVTEHKHECKDEDDCDAFFIHKIDKPIPMVFYCPLCHIQHVDIEEWATKPHKTHKCAGCSHEWRPSSLHTVGVLELEETS